jgi:hypothetical protein
MAEMRNAYKILVRLPEGKRTLGRHRHRWDNNKSKLLLLLLFMSMG